MADNLGVNPKTAFSSVQEGKDFPVRARNFVALYTSMDSTRSGEPVSYEETYIVWFSFVMGGWKALVSTSRPDGRYYEVTYNKDTGETYVDVYQKIDQEVWRGV